MHDPTMPADTAPAWDGVPLNPERDGWHWLLFRDGSRVCCWWNASAHGWASSDTPSYGADYLPEEAEQDHVTCEPCLTPSEVTERETAAFAAGAEAMREMAEASADCGCDVRAIVLERLASHGLREAERCCGQHYDACCALTANAIRALPLPPMPTQGGAGDE